MKTIVAFLSVLFLLTTTSLFAQDRKTAFENASFVKSSEGASYMNISWKKGTENTAYYLVQRSNDGKEFKTIALVFTSEESNFCDYKFKDKLVASEENSAMYYRIAIVNEQKEMTYLPVKKVAFSTADASVVAPAFANAVATRD